MGFTWKRGAAAAALSAVAVTTAFAGTASAQEKSTVIDLGILRIDLGDYDGLLGAGLNSGEILDVQVGQNGGPPLQITLLGVKLF